MKRLLPIGFLLALFSAQVLAGGYFVNDTGETVYGLRVEFSEPVTVTGFGDVLPTIDPPGESTTFTFSGGAVEPWGDHWMIWEPASASIVSEEWLTNPAPVPEAASSQSETALAPVMENMQFVNIFWWWDYVNRYGMSWAEVARQLGAIEEAGYGGVSLDYWMFVDSVTASHIYKMHVRNPPVGQTMRTPRSSELEKWLEIIRSETDLAIDFRVQLKLSQEFTESYGEWVNRSCLEPDDVSSFFESYYSELVEPLAVCEEYDVEICTVMVELNTLEAEADQVHWLLDSLDPLFSGRFAISQMTNMYLLGDFACGTTRGLFEDFAGSFWDWADSEGAALIIGMNCIEPSLAASSTASSESMVQAFVATWRTATEYFRRRFPSANIWLSELGASQHRGTSMGHDPDRESKPKDPDEMGRVLSAVIVGARELGIEGFSLLYYSFWDEEWHRIIPDAAKPAIEELLK